MSERRSSTICAVVERFELDVDIFDHVVVNCRFRLDEFAAAIVTISTRLWSRHRRPHSVNTVVAVTFILRCATRNPCNGTRICPRELPFRQWSNSNMRRVPEPTADARCNSVWSKTPVCSEHVVVVKRQCCTTGVTSRRGIVAVSCDGSYASERLFGIAEFQT